MKRILFFVIGILLILVGVVGWILPVMPGWPFIFLGLSFIAPRLAERVKHRVLRKLFKQDFVLLDSWKKNGTQAGFTTRHFPLVLKKTDDLLDSQKQEQFIRYFSKLNNNPSGQSGLFEKFALLNQVHGDGVAVLFGPEKYSEKGFYHIPQCDAAITDIQGMTLLVFTADCLSVFFSAGSWVGLAHAGWRGTQKKITAKTFQLLLENSGVSSGEVKISFGPSIGVKHYEVGQEFQNIFPSSSLMFIGKGSHRSLHFDLAKENKRQLLELEADPKNMADYGICTVSENKNFYSFRKEKDAAGRMISFIQRS